MSADLFWPLLVLGVAAVLGLARWRHVATRRRVEKRFQDFQERVINLRQRVEAVKDRHKLLPGSSTDLQAPMAGATLALYKQVEDETRRLGDDWLRRMDVWDKVQVLVRSPAWFRVGHFKESERQLDELGTFDAVEQACTTCVTHLDRIEQGHQQARARLKEAEDKAGRASAPIDAVRNLGLPTAPYEAELQRCAGLTEKGRQLLAADPVGAQETLADAVSKLDALGGRIEDIIKLWRRAPTVLAEVDRVGRLVSDRRAGGLLLTEPDGNPDPLLERGHSRHGDALEAIRRGDPEAAASQLDQSAAQVKEAEALVVRQAEARALCARELPARRAEMDRLRPATGDARSKHAELERGFAASSWQAVAGHCSRADDLQRTATDVLHEADTAAASSVQHYFRAAALLAQVRKQQEQAQELLREVGRCLDKLTQLRRECLQRRQEVQNQALQAQRYFTAQQPMIRQSTRSQFDAAEARSRQAAAVMDGMRPDWPAAQQHLEEVGKAYAAALKAAEEDVQLHQQLTAKLADAERDAERVGNFLARHMADRPQANQLYRTAADALLAVRRDLGGRQTDWSQLLKRVDEAAANLTKADQLAREDLRLSDRADAEIEEAERQLRRARDFSQRGISAHAAPAEGLLAQARQRRDAQAYEEAISRATAAQQAARQAHDEAANRARQEELRLEQERQRLESPNSFQPQRNLFLDGPIRGTDAENAPPTEIA